MRNLVIGLLLGSAVSLIASDKALSNEQRLKAELYKMRVQVAQCQLSLEQSRLLNEFSSTLGASDGQEFDWETLTYKEKK